MSSYLENLSILSSYLCGFTRLITLMISEYVCVENVEGNFHTVDVMKIMKYDMCALITALQSPMFPADIGQKLRIIGTDFSF